jgi:23S rRNA (cytosine1962-C5)-methyltransferase
MSLPDFNMLANRLRKMNRHYTKWAKKKNISCFRIYDADIPEFPLAIDWYEHYLHVAEYKRNHKLSFIEAAEWWSKCRTCLCESLDVREENIFFKTREQQKGKQQYAKFGEDQAEKIVKENGLKFWINLSDYLDTGLFLDHRNTRQMVREISAGKTVLNLFAYTGSFSVYAADGGAVETTTIDISNTYLQWAQRNMELNKIKGKEHKFIRADIKQWLKEPVKDKYDLVILDPPTFSNSKLMKDVLDIQRDHAELINLVLKRVYPGGTIYFSTNFRKFRIDTEAIESNSIKDISATTIPEDFRNKKIHYCFEIVNEI